MGWASRVGQVGISEFSWASCVRRVRWGGLSWASQVECESLNSIIVFIKTNFHSSDRWTDTGHGHCRPDMTIMRTTLDCFKLKIKNQDMGV